MIKARPFFALFSAFVLLTSFSCGRARAAVTINSAFPGGNVLVQKIEGDTAYIGPDLRGGKPWFYWYFEAQSGAPGKATFLFRGPGAIGVRGPAFSTDGGKNWQWMGVERVIDVPLAGAPEKAKPQQGFTYDFTKANEKVRFSVGIPYVQSNFDEFAAKQAGNPHLVRSVLTKSAKGRPVEFLQIGKPGPGKKGMILTARHHACEALASYVMEGFLAEALSETDAARRFRESFVLYVVPFVDKDGVEDGDQGKNRDPHDHNRDYGDAPIFPEIKAIQEFAAKTSIQVSVDLHCPALAGDIHEAFHFLGLGTARVNDNLNEWISWIEEERPPLLGRPINYLVDGTKPNAVNTKINSHYFAVRPDVLMAATLEIPYTQPNVPLGADLARQYGAGMLKGLNRLTLVTTAGEPRGAAGHEGFEAWRKTFLKIYRNKPLECEAIAKTVLDDPKAAPPYRAEANTLMGMMRLWHRKLPEALPYLEAVLNDPAATTAQKVAAFGYRQRVLALHETTTPAAFEAALAQAVGYPALNRPPLAGLYLSAVDFYEKRGEYEKAVAASRQLFPVAADYEKGKTLLRTASLYDLAKQPDKALASRQEAVALLRKQIGVKAARSVFGGMMVTDLFDAVMSVPASTVAEKQAALDMALAHEVVPVAIRDRIKNAAVAAGLVVPEAVAVVAPAAVAKP